MLEELVPLIRFCGFQSHASDTMFILLKQMEENQTKQNQSNMTFGHRNIKSIAIINNYIYLCVLPSSSTVSPPEVNTILIFVMIILLL